VLLLDYDGTLAPFRERRDEAVPYPGVLGILARMPGRGSGRFAVVSGRPVAAIRSFLAPVVPSEIWGCHGAERFVAHGTGQAPTLSPALALALERARTLALPLAGAGALEEKPVSLALHWRGLAEEARGELAGRVGPLWEDLARESGLLLHAFDGGLELRVPGWDKGLAVRAIEEEEPEAVLVYCGDDLTDEDAFAALGPSGIGVLVRSRARDTAADYRISPPQELLRFLQAWAMAGGGENRNQEET
jgi:trehalose-phosphatase